jgi:uncharacterized LabA/DUF88 family protein
MSRRVAVYIDGFNLYHSLAQTAHDLGDPSVKWLDLIKLSESFLHNIGGDCELSSVHYFTALPLHLHLTDPGRLHRHRTYLRALSATGLTPAHIHLGKIRQQKITIVNTDDAGRIKIWREKGTDVSLAINLMRDAHLCCLDEAVIVSGDSDYVPLARVLHEIHPDIGLRFAFPRGRSSRELSMVAPRSFVLTTTTYLSCRLPKSLRLPSGKRLEQPSEWVKG